LAYANWLAAIGIAPQRNFPLRRPGEPDVSEALPCGFGGKATIEDTLQGKFAQKGKPLLSRSSCKYGATAKLDARPGIEKGAAMGALSDLS
jgi:hypothetical protein